jgi:hypothetical protein
MMLLIVIVRGTMAHGNKLVLGLLPYVVFL